MALTDGVVRLRPVEQKDLAQLRDWRNDPDLRRRVREHRLLNMENQYDWLRQISKPDTHDLMFAAEAHVVVQDSDGPAGFWPLVGMVGLCYWNPRERTAEVSFYIGDPAARGKGYATRALQLLHRYGFEELGLERITAECYANNEPGLKTLKRVGYTVEGTLRSHVYREGRRWDAYVLGLLREEWKP